MELIIRIEDGQPYGNPIFVSHMKLAFPDFVTDPLPQGYAFFDRRPAPEMSMFQVIESSYVWDGDIVADMHVVRDMTQEEKDATIAELKKFPPTPGHVWNETEYKWEATPRPNPPETGGPYRFNPFIWQWVSCPEPLYPNWVVEPNGKFWVAPVEKPTDDKFYVWSVEENNWIERKITDEN